jgi:ABC-type Na+ transport system ATPase subunit NatA
MIEAQHLTKRYGHTVAVDEASFVVRPGRVTGFLGPGVALAVLGGYAALALTAASLRASHSDA